MAIEKVLNTRIQLKYDSYTNWSSINPTLKSGEVAIAYLAESHTNIENSDTHPVMFKVGPGEFNSLPWASALAADVHAWAKKSENDFKAWVKSIIDVTDIDTYSKSEIDGKLAANSTADQKYAKEYADGLAGNYDAAGAAKEVSDALEAYKTANNAAVAGKVSNSDFESFKTANTAAITNAQTAAETKAQELVNGLSTYVGTLPEGTTATSVVDYVNVKTAGIATDAALEELNNQVNGLQDAVDAIEEDYLKGSDKTELQGNIDTVSSAVETEKGRAEGAEAGLATRIKAIEDDYLKTADKYDDTALAARVKAVEDDYLKKADKTELENKITANSTAIELLTNGVSAEEVDGVNDLIQYVKEHGAEVTGMKEDIAENAAAIAKEIGDRESAIESVQGQINALGIANGKVANAAMADKANSLTDAAKAEVKAVKVAAADAADEATHATSADKATDADKLGGVVAADYALKTDVATATGDAVAAHNTDEEAHSDIRTAISDLGEAVEDALAAAGETLAGLTAQFNTKLAENLTAASEESSAKDAVVLAEAQNAVAAHAEDTDLHVTADKQAAWDAAKATADTAIQSVTAAADSGLKATQTGTSVAIEIDESITWIFNCGGASI